MLWFGLINLFGYLMPLLKDITGYSKQYLRMTTLFAAMMTGTNYTTLFIEKCVCMTH